MFKIFRRRKDKPALTYGVIQRLNEALERKQKWVAGYLNSRTRKFSKRRWMWLLVMFCLSFGTVATDILCDSMRKDKIQENDRHPQNISVPAFILHKNKETDSLQMLEQLYEHRNLIKQQKSKEWKNK